MAYRKEKDEAAIQKLDSIGIPRTVLANGMRVYEPAMVRYDRGLYHCPACDFTTPRGRMSLIAHSNLKHHGKQYKISLPCRLFQCPHCGKKLDNAHVISWRCSCKKARAGGYCLEQDYRKHMRLHTYSKESKTFYCCPFCSHKVCGKGIETLSTHLVEHGRTCLVCGELRDDDSHVYGDVYNRKTEKRFIVCSMLATFSFEVKKEQILTISSKEATQQSTTGNVSSLDKNVAMTSISVDSSTSAGLPTVTILYEPDRVEALHESSLEDFENEGSQKSNSDSLVSSSSDENEYVDLTAEFYKIKDSARPYQCYYCVYVTSIAAAINSHIASVHVDPQDYSCRLCVSFKASRKANWMSHMVAVHAVCTHILDQGIAMDTTHSFEAGQMLHLAKNSDVSSCAQCAFKFAEVSNAFKRKRARTSKKKSRQHQSKRMKRAKSQGVSLDC